MKLSPVRRALRARCALPPAPWVLQERVSLGEER